MAIYIQEFWSIQNNDFLPIIKNSKKFLKIIKFGLIVYFDIEITLSNFDWKFGYLKRRYGPGWHGFYRDICTYTYIFLLISEYDSFF